MDWMEKDSIKADSFLHENKCFHVKLKLKHPCPFQLFIINWKWTRFSCKRLIPLKVKWGIAMNINFGSTKRMKRLFQSIYSRIENLLFTVLCRLPDNVIPVFFQNWLNDYSEKRIAKLKQQIIRKKWEIEAWRHVCNKKDSSK